MKPFNGSGTAAPFATVNIGLKQSSILADPSEGFIHIDATVTGNEGKINESDAEESPEIAPSTEDQGITDQEEDTRPQEETVT